MLVTFGKIGDNGCMSSTANVLVHASQFPEAVRCDLLESLRTRRINHKFHYDSVKQTQKWLALHQAYAPSRNDAEAQAIYDKAFAAAVGQVSAPKVAVVGLGCGGGQKDTRLLKLLTAKGKQVAYVPSDVSAAMTLVARQTAGTVVSEDQCFPLVCDLVTATDLPAVLDKLYSPGSVRILTFFGMIPNFEPDDIVPKLAALLRPGDALLFSANLAPGTDYAAGVQRVLPQYDNPLTRDWLMSFLTDLGVGRDLGEIRFIIEDAQGLKRIVAGFHFLGDCRVQVDSETFEFRTGESIRLFFSFRHTPALVRTILAPHGLRVLGEWIASSGEEGVFLVVRAEKGH